MSGSKPPTPREPGPHAGAPLDRNAVLEVLRAHPSATKRDVARLLGLDSEQKLELKQLLRALEAEGVIDRAGRRAFKTADTLPPVAMIEVVDRDDDGGLRARPVERRNLSDDGAALQIRIAAREADGRRGRPTLGPGDRALARLTREADGAYSAKIMKALGRDGRRLLAVVREAGAIKRLEPTNRALKHDLALRKSDQARLNVGDLVVVTASHERLYGLKTADIVDVIGDAAAPNAASLIALHEHGVPDGFSEAELAEAAAAPSPEDLIARGGRKDLTHLPLITIDPADARDHDDAVWAAPDDRRDNRGGHQVIVAIADVAAYVRPGSALDRGAQERGVSVYFPDRVTPMLPERLSTDLCSLREGALRPCLAVRMVFDAQGHKRSHAFVRATMRSAAKLSYEQAQAAIDGEADDAAKPLLEPVLKPLWAAYRAVAAAREARAPLALDLPERRVRLGPDGRVAEIATRERFDAHRLIEEFMILANVCAAETLEQKRSPLIYRVHDSPSREKLASLADFLPSVGLSWNKGEPAQPKRFNHLLARAAEGDGEHAEAVSEMILRSQAQAVYTPENIGHFGLSLARYAHFTSPIRRYADLIVHRALVRALGLGPEPHSDGLSDAEIPRLQSIAERVSTAERRAMAAERDAVDRYLAAYLADRVNGVFDARITGVTRAGCFLKLAETGADGLAPISRLGQEYFIFDAADQALIGEETGGRYRLGMKVEARLVEATPETGGLLFEIDTPPEPGHHPRHKRGRRGPARGHRGGPGRSAARTKPSKTKPSNTRGRRR